MSRDELEYSIARYADGTLPSTERAALDALVDRDADARALLEAERALVGALKACRATPLPQVRWDRLAEQISSEIARAGTSVSSGTRDVPEELEFALAQYADGTLPETNWPAIEARLADDPGLLAIVGEYETVDAIAREASSLPPVRWDALAERLSQAVARDGGRQLSEQDEFAVAQYADGTLAGEHRAVVEAKLDADGIARLALADYAGLDAALKTAPLPDVHWERLADHLSDAVASEGEVEAESATSDREPDTRSFRLFAWTNRPMWLAAAASVVLAIGIGIRLSRPHPNPINDGHVTPAPASVLFVTGPSPEAAKADAVAEISIGPSLALQQMPSSTMDYATDVVSRPSRVIVASAVPVVDDDERSQPY